MDLVRENTYDNDLLFVTANSGSGKLIIIRILENYPKIEKMKEDYIFYHISRLYKFGKIDMDTAACVLKIYKDTLLYDLMVCRNINFRVYDDSSLFKYPYPLDYIKRIFHGEHKEINKRISSEKPIYQTAMVNGLSYSDLFFHTFETRLKMIYILRNPIEIIKQNIINSYSDNENRIGIDPCEVQFSYRYKNKILPIYANGWEDEYLKANPIERTIRFLYETMLEDYKMYDELPDKYKRNVLFITFDELVTNPYKVISNINIFLNNKPSNKIKSTLRKEKCPRVINIKQRNENWKIIINTIDKPYVEMFNLLMEEYEKRKKEYEKMG